MTRHFERSSLRGESLVSRDAFILPGNYTNIKEAGLSVNIFKAGGAKYNSKGVNSNIRPFGVSFAVMSAGALMYLGRACRRVGPGRNTLNGRQTSKSDTIELCEDCESQDDNVTASGVRIEPRKARMLHGQGKIRRTFSCLVSYARPNLKHIPRPRQQPGYTIVPVVTGPPQSMPEREYAWRALFWYRLWLNDRPQGTRPRDAAARTRQNTASALTPPSITGCATSAATSQKASAPAHALRV